MAILSVDWQRFTIAPRSPPPTLAIPSMCRPEPTPTTLLYRHPLTLQAIGGVAKIIATQSALFGKAIIVEGVRCERINGFDTGRHGDYGNGAGDPLRRRQPHAKQRLFHNNRRDC